MLVQAKSLSKVRGQVKIGAEFYMEAEGDVNYISVETGVPGLYIDLAPAEAMEYIPKRENILAEKLNRSNHHINEIQLHISSIHKTLPLIGEINIEEPLPNSS